MNTETSELVDTKAEFKSYESLHPFLWAGNSTVTLVSKKSGKRFTYKIQHAKKQFSETRDDFYISGLFGPDNEHDYKYLGMFDLIGHVFKLTKASIYTESAPSIIMFRWFMTGLFADPERLFEQAELWHEGKCGRCGRKLTVPESIANGIGPDCMSKM